MPQAGRFQRIYRGAAFLVLAVGAAIAFAGWWNASVAVPGTVFRIDGTNVLVAGIVTAVVGLLLVRFPSPAAFSVLLTVGLIALAFVVGARDQQKGDREIAVLTNQPTEKVWLSETDWQEPFTEDSTELGHRGKSNTNARQRHRDYDVVYRLGPDGFRVMPEPKNQDAPKIVFVGCSFTFGQGCQNEETYPWILAEKTWPGYRVLNWSVCGWGTGHCLLMVDKALAMDPKPALIIYSFFGDHVRRNASRKSWHHEVKGPFPLFNDRAEFQGIKDWAEASLPDSPETDNTENRITQAMIDSMSQKCASAGVPLAFVILNSHDPFGRDTMQFFQRPGTIVVDVRPALVELFPNDGHPTPLSHLRIARAIARDPQITELLPQPPGSNPQAYPDRFPGEDSFRLELRKDDSPDRHRVAKIEATPENASVHDIKLWSKDVTDASVIRLLPGCQAGQYCLLSYRVTSDQPRSMRAALGNWSPPFEAIGWERQIDTSSREHRYPIRVARAYENPRFILRFGADDTSFRIENFSAKWVDRLPEGYDWLETFEEGVGSSGRRTLLPDGRGVRIDEMEVPKAEGWMVQYHVAGIPVEAGKTYRVSAHLSADQAKKVSVGIYDLSEPAKAISEFCDWNVTPERQEHACTVTASVNEPVGIITLYLGNDVTPVELDGVRMEEVQP